MVAEHLSEEDLYDTWVIDRHIKKGFLTPEQVQAHFEEAIDVGEQGDHIDMQQLQLVAEQRSQAARRAASTK